MGEHWSNQSVWQKPQSPMFTDAVVLTYKTGLTNSRVRKAGDAW